MKVKIITGPNNYDLLSIYQEEIDDYVIGVDNGSIIANKNKIKVDLAIGDFDSVDTNELNQIKSFSNKFLKFKRDKDYTDTYLAVKEALLLDPEEIIIYGGIGKRVDHTLANIKLLKLGNITMLNNNTTMYVLDPGSYEINGNYDYISFFAIEEVKELNLIDFSFQLEKYNLKIDDPLCISNKGNGYVSFTKGTLLVIEEKE